MSPIFKNSKVATLNDHNLNKEYFEEVSTIQRLTVGCEGIAGSIGGEGVNRFMVTGGGNRLPSHDPSACLASIT